MKRLILVRHGKSSWEYDLPDEQRPLKKRGYKDGKLVSNTFKAFFTGPALLWSSPATRALETGKIFKKCLNISDENFEIKNSLYTFNSESLIKILRSAPDNTDKLVVFGHNPAFTTLVNKLGDKSLGNLPTTGLCVIDFDVENWKDIKKGKTILILIPKNLR